MNPSAPIISADPVGLSTSIAVKKFAANALEALDAEVRPEHITANVSRNVRKWMPNALCVYTAAPPACGYFVTSSR